MPSSGSSGEYWTRRALGRRRLLRGGALGVAGIAGAALVGCGGDEGPPASAGTPRVTGTLPAARGSATPRAAATGTRAGADEVRLEPGIYDDPLAPTVAEASPSINAVPGGTLVDRYLEPPHLDINRTLSCTVYHPMTMSNSKLVRAKSGASADPFYPEIEPDLAESWEMSPDLTEVTFHLRRGVLTHNVAPANGREFTSEDVRVSIERYRRSGSQQDVFAMVSSVEAPDAHTVRLRLNQPMVDFPAAVSSWSFMWLKEFAENDDLLQGKAVGTGPMVHEEWAKGERSVFAKHPGYFEAGRPYIDRYIALIEDDTAAQRAAFLEGGMFTWHARNDEDADDAESDVDTMVLWRRPRSRGANVNGWHFQMNNKAFQDERVRRAISLGVDREELDELFNAGDNRTEDGPYSNGPMPWPFLYESQPTAAANGRWYQFDPTQASQLLRAAGYSGDDPLTWTHVAGYDHTVSIGGIIPGINRALTEVHIEVREVDAATQIALLADQTFDGSIGIVWGPPANAMDQWIYPWYHTKGTLNYNAKGNANLDRLLETQRGAETLPARQDAWRSIWDTIHDQVWDLWWPEPHSRSAWHNWVLNYRPHGLLDSWTCYNSQSVSGLWLDEDAPQRRS